MGEVAADLQRQFEAQVVEACDRIFSEGVKRMRKDIEGAGLLLTEDLKRSLYSERYLVTGQLEAAFRMGMRGYGRFKDMRTVRISQFPNVDAIKEFIEEVGVEKFINNESVTLNGKSVQLYVPGYYIGSQRKGQLTAERAATRIAYAMGAARQSRNTIKRRGNSFYNVNKGEIYSDIIQYLMTKLPANFMVALKDYYERPFYEKEGYWG